MPLRALATSLEGRYTFLPGLYGAARVEHLGFSRIAGSDENRRMGRAGHARRGRRRLLPAAQPDRASLGAVQRRDGGRVPCASFVAASCSTGSDDAHAPDVAPRASCLVAALLLASRAASPAQRPLGRDPRPRRHPARRAAARAAARAAELGVRRAPRELPDTRRAVVYLETAPAAALEARDPGRGAHGPAQRDVPAACPRRRCGHGRRLSEQRRHVPQRVLALEDQAVRPRPLRARQVEVRAVRSPGHRARVLRHPLAHERVRPGVQPSVLRDDRRSMAATGSTTSRPAPTRWRRGTRARRATRRTVTIPAQGGAVDLDFVVQ